MAVSMTINSISESWLSGSLSISDNINDRSTCNFTVDTNNTISTGLEVIILDGATRIFAGTIDSFKRTSPKGTSLKRYDITCVDFNQLADKRRVAASYESKTVTYIVNDIITNYLTAEGVTAGTIQIGPTIEQAVFNYCTATEALDYLKDVSGLNWNINYSKQLDIFYRSDYADTGFTDALNNFIDAEVEETRQDYRNRQYIRAGQDTTDTILLEKLTPKPDGISRKFFCRYPLASKPLIYVDTVQVDPDDIGIGGLDTGKKWYWNKNNKDIDHDESETVLSSSSALTASYEGLVPIIVLANNPSGQVANGIYESLEDMPNLDKKDAALDYAKGLLQKYADIPKKVRIFTQTYKLSGKLIPISISNLGIDDNYLIESVQIQEQEGQFFYTINCLSGESLGSWVEFFRKLVASKANFTIRENEVLVVLLDFPETHNWVESSGQTVYSCNLCSDSQVCSDSIYVC